MTTTDDLLVRELYLLIYKFLQKSPLNETFQVLEKELLAKKLFPSQYNLNGNELSTANLNYLINNYPNIDSNYLLNSLKQCYNVLNIISPTSINVDISFLHNGIFSLTRAISNKPLLNNNSFSLETLSIQKNGAPIFSSNRFKSEIYPGPITQILFSRVLSGPRITQNTFTPNFYEQYHEYHSTLGHLSSIFCMEYDRRGKILFTGADDALIKIWSATSGRLLATLRGHQGEITDLSVSIDNDILASGSTDKRIRLWNLRTTALITTFSHQEDQISGVKFCPLMNDNTRYLVSISWDGSVCFYKYDAITKQFDAPIRFVERKKRTSQMQACSFSSGGSFVAVGSTDGLLLLFVNNYFNIIIF